MEIRAAAIDVTRARVDAILVGVFAGSRSVTGAAAEVDRAISGAIRRLLASGNIKGKCGDVESIYTLGQIRAERVVVVGLGSRREFTEDRLRSAMGEVARRLRATGAKTIASVVHDAVGSSMDLSRAAQAITEGTILGLYQFDKYKAGAADGGALREFIIPERVRSRLPAIREGIRVGRILADSVCLARDMVNEPANRMTPTDMARVARGVGQECSLDVSVLDREEMERLGMGAILGVARGSAEPPAFIIMKYVGDPGRPGKAVGLIGKGVTFDAGGISLKPATGMSSMKTDMAGGAGVIAAMRAIGLLKPRTNVTALVPAAENMPSSTAQKPGDIVTAMNGKTIEVENTDAEGRLLLADALCYGRQLRLSPMIDIATLTGAMRTTFGDICTGAFTNHQPTLNRLLKSAAAAGEKVWQLPMFEEYKESIRSDVADVKNSGSRLAGSMAAAWFLAEFTGGSPWVHLDIAGAARRDATKGYQTKGATGVMVRTLTRYIVEIAGTGLDVPRTGSRPRQRL